MSVLSESQWAFFEALAIGIAPGSGTLDSAERAAFRGIVEDALVERPPGLQRQLRLFLRVVRWLPALRYGAPLDRLSGASRDAALEWFQDCPLPIVRKGFWGLKALVFMGYYGRPGAGAAIGYDPVPDGNERLRQGR